MIDTVREEPTPIRHIRHRRKPKRSPSRSRAAHAAPMATRTTGMVREFARASS